MHIDSIVLNLNVNRYFNVNKDTFRIREPASLL